MVVVFVVVAVVVVVVAAVAVVVVVVAVVLVVVAVVVVVVVVAADVVVVVVLFVCLLVGWLVGLFVCLCKDSGSFTSATNSRQISIDSLQFTQTFSQCGVLSQQSVGSRSQISAIMECAVGQCMHLNTSP